VAQRTVLAGRHALVSPLGRGGTGQVWAVTAGLAHPGVPAIYDAGEYDGGLFLVMELVDG
jgi:serine/threonine protein kinase